jgi:hypothetical protein
MSRKGDLVMKIRHGGDLVTVVSVAVVLVCSWITPALAQAPSGSFAGVVSAARSWPGCLGVETGQTSSGKRVIFAWFENKKALVGWYHSEVHQKAMKTAFPNQTFDREPLPDTPEDSGPILAIVSLKLLDTPKPDATSMPIAAIGIELYTPLPGGVAVGGRFAPEAIKVRGLREIELGSAQGQPR